MGRLEHKPSTFSAATAAFSDTVVRNALDESFAVSFPADLPPFADLPDFAVCAFAAFAAFALVSASLALSFASFASR